MLVAHNHSLMLYLLFVFLLSNCSTPTVPHQEASVVAVPQPQVDTLIIEPLKPIIPNLKVLHQVPNGQCYEQVKQTIRQERLALKSDHVTALSQLFKQTLVHQIIPFWEGTPWSFEGHTSTPKSGEIACGYFVSTTLKHVGLNLNRYHLAQQSPINEAKSLAIKIAVKEFAEATTTENIEAINAYLKEGIHFIGFDQNHVGYILKEKGALYLIHSNYLNGMGVSIEPIETSEVFQSFERFYITELSTNPHLLVYWRNGMEISIVKN